MRSLWRDAADERCRSPGGRRSCAMGSEGYPYMAVSADAVACRQRVDLLGPSINVTMTGVYFNV